MAYKEIDKEFCLTDDSVNCYGYRMLTEGLDLSQYNPPIGYLMHDREKGVAVKWGSFRKDGDKLFAKPSINTSLFPNLPDGIMDGFYQGASIGMVVPLEWSDEPEMKLPGQTDVTLTKWYFKECSIVDIPGNKNALAKLYYTDGSVMRDLSFKTKTNNSQQNEQEMKELIFTASMLALMDLKADADASEVETKLAGLVAKAKKTEELQKQLDDLKSSTDQSMIEEILSSALKEGKITNELKVSLAFDYKNNPEGLKNLVDKMPAQQRVTGKQTEEVPEKYQGKSYEQLYLSGELETLKANYPDYYEQLKTKK